MSAPSRQHGKDVHAVQKSCLNKRRFTDELTARAGAQIHCDEGKARNGVMWIYACENCRGWHMTSGRGALQFRVTSESMFASDPFAGLSE